MKSFVALCLAATALAIPQSSTPPAGCSASSSGTFQISTVNVTSPKKRGIEARQLAGALTLTLSNGILKDQAGRTGYIASNYQFQFDNPVQAGARETSGFSLCSNGSLALNNGRPSGAAVWFSCLSGSFYNLYSQSTGAQCIPIYIVSAGSGGQASQASDGQPQVTQTPRVSQISDGQPQATSPRPVVSQISDGQPQASSPRAPVVSQISDGQPQAPKPTSRAPVVSQISDGQPQAPAPTSRAVVSQISDGQPQVPAPSSRAPVVSQISDGQPQAPAPTTRTNGTVASASRSAPAQFTGAAPTGQAAAGALAAGLIGLFALL